VEAIVVGGIGTDVGGITAGCTGAGWEHPAARAKMMTRVRITATVLILVPQFFTKNT
jgi:hypothetical protein